MKILKQSAESLTKKDIYKLTQDPGIKKMAEAVSQKFEVKAWALFEDAKADNATGEVKTEEILAIMTNEGDVYATNSPTFKREFENIVEIFGNELDVIEVMNGKSKAGRTFITVRYAG